MILKRVFGAILGLQEGMAYCQFVVGPLALKDWVLASAVL